MEKLTVYLAGACRGMHDDGKEWRLKAENIFKNISEAKDVTIKVINPTRYLIVMVAMQSRINK